MKSVHLTAYFDKTAPVERRFVVDQDMPDQPDGTRTPGTEGRCFPHAQAAGNFVADWLRIQKNGKH